MKVLGLPAAALSGVLLALLLMPGCGKKGHDPVRPVGQAVPDFALVDLNPNSATTGLAVSPRQYVGKVSATAKASSAFWTRCRAMSIPP